MKFATIIREYFIKTAAKVKSSIKNSSQNQKISRPSTWIKAS